MKMTSQEYFDYIGNDFAVGWLTNSSSRDRGIFVPLVFMKMCGGNANVALVLSQIMYWSSISRETMEPRMTHWFKGHLWIVKTHAEWGEEIRINPRTVKEALCRLEKEQIIIKEKHRSPYHLGKDGTPMTVSFVRLNWKVFLNKVDFILRSKKVSSE